MRSFLEVCQPLSQVSAKNHVATYIHTLCFMHLLFCIPTYNATENHIIADNKIRTPPIIRRIVDITNTKPIMHVNYY